MWWHSAGVRGGGGQQQQQCRASVGVGCCMLWASCLLLHMGRWLLTLQQRLHGVVMILLEGVIIMLCRAVCRVLPV
jgi:hypothetical protein